MIDKKILIIDFGSQYTQLIGRRIRELGVYCEIYPYEDIEKRVESFNPAGIIFSGSPSSSNVSDAPQVPASLFEKNIPILGICYGMQIMSHVLGGEIISGSIGEYGPAKVIKNFSSNLFKDIEDSISTEGLSILDVWMSHGDHVAKIPESFQVIASTDNCTIAAIADEKRRFYGLQFHPEVSHTRQGKKILERFVISICGCTPNFKPNIFANDIISGIRDKVKDEHVILGLSGGVDSSVAALLLHKAIGKQLHCVFIDTGLMRLNEPEQIKSLFENQFEINLITVDAKQQFFSELKNVDDPEKKTQNNREIIY